MRRTSSMFQDDPGLSVRSSPQVPNQLHRCGRFLYSTTPSFHFSLGSLRFFTAMIEWAVTPSAMGIDEEIFYKWTFRIHVVRAPRDLFYETYCLQLGIHGKNLLHGVSDSEGQRYEFACGVDLSQPPATKLPPWGVDIKTTLFTEERV